MNVMFNRVDVDRYENQLIAVPRKIERVDARVFVRFESRTAANVSANGTLATRSLCVP